MSYRAVNYKGEVVDGICSLLHIDVEADLDQTTARNIAQRVNAWVRSGWSYWPFKELESTEERAFRPIHSPAFEYQEGDEVYGLDSELYYRALAATSVGDLLSDASKWAVMTPPLDRFIAFQQFGKQAIGQMLGIFLTDPRLTKNPRRINFTLTSQGVTPVCGTGGNKTVWITFRPQQPVFTSDEYDPDKEYTQGTLVYDQDSGDCYRALIGGTGNEISDASSWYRQRFPYVLAEYVKQYVAADLAEDLNTRAAMRSDGEDKIIDEIRLEQEQGVRSSYGLQQQTQRYWWDLRVNAAIVEVG